MLATQLANYIIILDDAAAVSSKLDDKPLYEKYLAHAGLMLALAVLDKDKQRLIDAIEAHENLWVHSWLVDDAYSLCPRARLGSLCRSCPIWNRR